MDIQVSLPNGSIATGTAWETTPFDIAKNISKSLSERVVAALVDGTIWDLHRPLEKSCAVELVDFEHEAGKEVFWHSSAHLLGKVCELYYGSHLSNGPPIEDGFYYDMAMTDG